MIGCRERFGFRPLEERKPFIPAAGEVEKTPERVAHGLETRIRAGEEERQDGGGGAGRGGAEVGEGFAERAAGAGADLAGDPADEEGVAAGFFPEGEAVGLGGVGKERLAVRNFLEHLQGGGLIEPREWEGEE